MKAIQWVLIAGFGGFGGFGGNVVHAYELAGKIRDGEDGQPIAGAVVRLQLRGDSVLTDAEGAFRIEVRPVGLLPRVGQAPSEFRPRIRAGLLEFHADGPSEIRIDLFGMDGRRVSGLGHRVAEEGIQGIPLGRLAPGFHGIGWLRLTADGRVGWASLVTMGSGGSGMALSGERWNAGRDRAGSAAFQASAKSASPASDEATSFLVVDTLQVLKPGYYAARSMVWDSPPGAGGLTLGLFRNSIFGMKASEVEAWKDHLTRPAVTIGLSKGDVTLPSDIGEGVLVFADGSEADRWSTDVCNPGPRPIRVRMAYTRGGRTYRDTLELEPFWNLIDFFHAGIRDTLTPYQGRFGMSWNWPRGVSATPERDWMELYLTCGFTDDAVVSHPDAFQTGVGFGIEGGMRLFHPFNPSDGRAEMKGSLCARGGFASYITLVRRGEHDLRVKILDWPMSHVPAVLKFTNAWPVDGLVRPDEKLRLQNEAGPAERLTTPVALELIDEAEWKRAESEGSSPMGMLLKYPFGNEALEWSFPYPLRDTLDFRFRIMMRDELGTMFEPCQVPGLSPPLRAVPSVGDSAATAYEPNETSLEAAIVPMGRWVGAALDYLGFGASDQDYYAFEAPTGRCVRLTFRNPGPREILVEQTFAGANAVFGPEPGQEMAIEFLIEDAGIHHFHIRSSGAESGYYAFRIDPIP